MIACIDRGLAPEDVKRMDLGHIIDYCIEYNELHDVEPKEKERPKKRKATQADWDALFG